MREPNETGHTFVSDSEFDALEKVVGFTNYHGYRYCATEPMVDDGDIYVLDPSGVEFFKNNYHGTKNPIFVKLEVSDLNRYLRMINRGDTHEDAMSRIEYDRIAFFDLDYDMKINNNDINRCVNILSLLLNDFFNDTINATLKTEKGE